LHSFGPYFAPWNAVAGRFREELFKQPHEPIDLYETALEGARFSEGSANQRPFLEYLGALFAKREPHLIVAMGAPAAQFVQSQRPRLFPSTPLLIAAADVRTINTSGLTINDAVVATAIDLPRLIENIMQVLPDTTNIAYVIGDSPLERFWVEELRRASEPFTERVKFEWFNELPFEEMVNRAASRPPHSAIFYASVRVDARGVPHEEDRVFSRLRSAANAPIFGYIDINFGQGTVGGPHLSAVEIGTEIASVASRILGGETPGNIKMETLGLQAPAYDWRELQRWDISERRLPPGSQVRFREQSLWERYRFELVAILVGMLAQTTIIARLMIERRARRKAEIEARQRSSEVLHLNRTAEIGALSASFAHELNQPRGHSASG
jgi:hypothetical protein